MLAAVVRAIRRIRARWSAWVDRRCDAAVLRYFFAPDLEVRERDALCYDEYYVHSDDNGAIHVRTSATKEAHERILSGGEYDNAFYHIVSFYGVRANPAANDNIMHYLHNDNVIVRGLSYPGHLKSGGRSDSVDDVVRAGIDVVQHLTNRGVKPSRIIMVGHSQGGVYASRVWKELFDRGWPVRLMTDSAPISMKAAATSWYQKPRIWWHVLLLPIVYALSCSKFASQEAVAGCHPLRKDFMRSNDSTVPPEACIANVAHDLASVTISAPTHDCHNPHVCSGEGRDLYVGDDPSNTVQRIIMQHLAESDAWIRTHTDEQGLLVTDPCQDQICESSSVAHEPSSAVVSELSEVGATVTQRFADRIII
jgi:hypothetical protein